MASVSRTNLRLRARQRADMEGSTFVADTELDVYLSTAYAKMVDIILREGAEERLLTYVDLTSASYALPAGFYRAHGLDLSLGDGTFTALKHFNWAERNRYRDTTVPRWRIIGSTLTFSPSTATPSVRLWYIADASIIGDGTGGTVASYDVYSGWDEFIVLDAALQMVIKEDRDPGPLAALLQACQKRLVSACAQLRIGDPETIAEVEHQPSEFDDCY